MRETKRLWMVLGMAFVGFSLSTQPVSGQETTDDDKQDVAVEEQVEAITLRVVNNNWSDMRIYAVRLGSRIRLGTVTSMTSETFAVPDFLQADVSDFQLLAVPIGGTVSVLSPAVYPSPGDEVVWGIQNHLALSGTPIG